jgi:hypothetical protein
MEECLHRVVDALGGQAPGHVDHVALPGAEALPGEDVDVEILTEVEGIGLDRQLADARQREEGSAALRILGVERDQAVAVPEDVAMRLQAMGPETARYARGVVDCDPLLGQGRLADTRDKFGVQNRPRPGAHRDALAVRQRRRVDIHLAPARRRHRVPHGLGHGAQPSRVVRPAIRLEMLGRLARQRDLRLAEIGEAPGTAHGHGEPDLAVLAGRPLHSAAE